MRRGQSLAATGHLLHHEAHVWEQVVDQARKAQQLLSGALAGHPRQQAANRYQRPVVHIQALVLGLIVQVLRI